MDGSADGDEVWEPLAAVLDTSFLHGGKFDRDQVEHLAQRLSQRDVKLWIPQQVIYEWAAHAAGALEALRSAQDLLRKSEILDAELPNKSKTAIVDEIQAMCEAMDNVVIVPMGGEAAAAAIRDQILGEGAGGVSKDGTRTGAVDSSIVRDAVRLVDEDLEKLVFLTGNKKDFNPAVKHLGLSGFQSATSIKLLLEKLRRPSAPPPEWRPAMTAIVASLMRDIRKATETDDRSGPPRAWIEVSDVSIGDLDDDEREDIEELVLDRRVEVSRSVQLVGVRAVSVEADGDAEIIGYTVVLLGDIAVVGAVIDNDGQAVFTSTTLQDRLIFADYEATLKDGQLGPAQQIGTATTIRALEEVEDSVEAYELLRNTLNGWCYLKVEDPKGVDGGFPQPFIVYLPGGRSEQAEVVPSSGSEWTLRFPDSGVEISAHYDHAAWVALGREDSFTMYPPVSLWSEVGNYVAHEPFSASVSARTFSAG